MTFDPNITHTNLDALNDGGEINLCSSWTLLLKKLEHEGAEISDVRIVDFAVSAKCRHCIL